MNWTPNSLVSQQTRHIHLMLLRSWASVAAIRFGSTSRGENYNIIFPSWISTPQESNRFLWSTNPREKNNVQMGDSSLQMV